MSSKLFTFSLFIFSFSILAGSGPEAGPYNPAKWTPTGQYLMQAQSGGPKEIHAFDLDGKLEQKAILRYSSEGRLLEEIYYNGKGERTGSTVYEYNNGNPVTEKLYGPKNRLRNRIVRTFENGKVTRIVNYNKDNQILSQQFFEYNQKGISGSEKVGDTIDSFFVHYLSGRPHRIDFKDSANGVFQEIQYVYDQSGKLIQRIRTNQASKSRCDHKYDSKGRLASLHYFDAENNNWELTRKITFVYPNQ